MAANEARVNHSARVVTTAALKLRDCITYLEIKIHLGSRTGPPGLRNFMFHVVSRAIISEPALWKQVKVSSLLILTSD